MRDLFSYSDGAVIRQGSAYKKTVKAKEVKCKTALSRSRLPGLDYALNPYEGCAHGCVYCYAPYVLRVAPHEWGKWVNAKVNLPSLIARELREKKGVVGIGTVTDPYQAAERTLLLTRRCLAELLKSDVQVSILTKSDLVLRDIPLLVGSSKVEVGMTVTARDDSLAAEFEPLASPPSRRLCALAEMNAKGIKTYALVAPIIPLVSDTGLDRLVSEIVETGTGRIMVDRLRLRPGMLDRIRRLDMFGDDELRSKFDSRVLSPSYFRSVKQRIRELTENAGLIFESTF
ncbi:MAG: radical SAM protein [Methanomassiliicoccales archaeon]|jgi:DNA repair photolyase